jgi:hypothetical protein
VYPLTILNSQFLMMNILLLPAGACELIVLAARIYGMDLNKHIGRGIWKNAPIYEDIKMERERESFILS